MKKLLLVTAIIAGSCSLVMAQGTGSSSGGTDPSASPSMTQNPKQGTTRDDNPKKKAAVVKSKKKSKKM
jgi:hypothetical protein